MVAFFKYDGKFELNRIIEVIVNKVEDIFHTLL